MVRLCSFSTEVTIKRQEVSSSLDKQLATTEFIIVPQTQAAPWFIFAMSLSLKFLLVIICSVATGIFTSSDAGKLH